MASPTQQQYSYAPPPNEQVRNRFRRSVFMLDGCRDDNIGLAARIASL